MTAAAVAAASVTVRRAGMVPAARVAVAPVLGALVVRVRAVSAVVPAVPEAHAVISAVLVRAVLPARVLLVAKVRA